MRLAAGLLILFLAAAAGGRIAAAAGGPLPGSVIGLLTLLPFLAVSAVRRVIEPAAELLLRHLPLFFVPACTGLVLWLDLLAGNAARLAAALVLSTWIGMIAAGWVAARLGAGSGRR